VPMTPTAALDGLRAQPARTRGSAITSIRSDTVAQLDCPTAVVAKAGTTFDCHCRQGHHDGHVTVKVLDSMGGLLTEVRGWPLASEPSGVQAVAGERPPES
jgi:hypothetical protein